MPKYITLEGNVCKVQEIDRETEAQELRDRIANYTEARDASVAELNRQIQEAEAQLAELEGLNV